MLLDTPVDNLEDLAQIVEIAQAEGRTVAHCHGVFDLLHLGHMRHFREARALADLLIVTITPDRYVNKGPGRPVFSEQLRAEAIASLGCVDHVVINRWPQAVDTIRMLHPDFYVKGPDYKDPEDDTTGGISIEQAAIEEVGGSFVCTDDITFSSSALINRHMPQFAPEMRSFLDSYEGQHSFKEIRNLLDRVKDLKVLVVGESIIDQYHYCRTMGKAGKEPILAARLEREEVFAGGILAVANHLAALSDNVELLSLVGTSNNYKSFIQQELSPEVKSNFIHYDGPTIVKRRFVESYPLQKLFEVYEMEDNAYPTRISEELCSNLDARLQDFDVVIVLDYGHGMLSDPARTLICEQAPFLALNTQINAGNQGFHTVSKYSRADFVCVSEQEARMDIRQTQRSLRDVVIEITRKLSAERMLVTRGNKGALSFSKSEGFVEVPAFGGTAIDRIGAGDRVLALTSLCAKAGASSAILGLLGNAVGFQAVQTIGHRQTLDRQGLLKIIEHTLK